MSKRDPDLALRQILSYSREAVEICQGKSRQNLDNERLLNLALTRLVEMIGEAANRVPENIQAQHSELPWLQMIAARNRLIHGYDSVDLDILWAIIRDDLPILIRQLENILGDEFAKITSGYLENWRFVNWDVAGPLFSQKTGGCIRYNAGQRRNILRDRDAKSL